MLGSVDRIGATTPRSYELDRDSRSIQTLHGQTAEVFDARIHDEATGTSHKGKYARFLPAEQITYAPSAAKPAKIYDARVISDANAARPVASSSQAPRTKQSSPNQKTKPLSFARYGESGEYFFMPAKLTPKDVSQISALGLYIKHHSFNIFHTLDPVVTQAAYMVNKTHIVVELVDDSGSMMEIERDGVKESRWEDAHHFVAVQTGITTHAEAKVVLAFLNDSTIYNVSEKGIVSFDQDGYERNIVLPKSRWYDVTSKKQQLYHRIHEGVESVINQHSAAGGTPLLSSIQRVLRQLSTHGGRETYLGEDDEYHTKPYLVIISTDGHPGDTRAQIDPYTTREQQSQAQTAQVAEIAAYLKRAIGGEFTRDVPVRFSIRLCTDEQAVVQTYRKLLENHPEIGPFVDVTAHLNDERNAYRAKHPTCGRFEMPHRRDLKVQSMIGPTTNLSRIKNKRLPAFYAQHRAIANPGKNADPPQVTAWNDGVSGPSIALGFPVSP